jgi:hypothetical protein
MTVLGTACVHTHLPLPGPLVLSKVELRVSGWCRGCSDPTRKLLKHLLCLSDPQLLPLHLAVAGSTLPGRASEDPVIPASLTLAFSVALLTHL